MTTGEHADEEHSGTVPATVMLVSSPGGHLQQLLALKPAWRDARRTWVTLPSADVGYLLAGEEVIFGYGPTNRSVKNLLRNLRQAWSVVRAHRPDAILSTGAALAVPFFLVGKLFGCRLVYVESVTRTERLSLSGRLAYPLVDHFFVQWPEAARGLRKARFEGSVL
jgi:UDP-N-acetylglucosamine:LPS N-acetylglucosamine transferase